MKFWQRIKKITSVKQFNIEIFTPLSFPNVYLFLVNVLTVTT